MNIPSRREQNAQPFGAGPNPKLGLLSNASGKALPRRLGVFEDATVSMLPDHPGREEGNRSEPLAHGLGQRLVHREPPIEKGVLVAGRRAGQPKPRECVVPDLPREGALHEQMVQGLGQLITEQASGVVLQPAARKSVGRPATILRCEPVEESDARRGPGLPDEPPASGKILV